MVGFRSSLLWSMEMSVWELAAALLRFFEKLQVAGERRRMVCAPISRRFSD